MTNRSGHFEGPDAAGDHYCETFAQRIGTALAQVEHGAKCSAKTKIWPAF